jgi:hypothetical protein
MTEPKELIFSCGFDAAFSGPVANFVRISPGNNVQSGITSKFERNVEIERLQVLKDK